MVINSCAIREAAEQKVIGRMGALARLKAANPALRVVLTGCSVRADGLGGPAAAVSGRGPVPATRPGAGADGTPGPRHRDIRSGTRSPHSDDGCSGRRVGRHWPRPPTACPGRAQRPSEQGTILRRGGSHAWLPDHLRLRQDLHLLHRALQPRTGAQPSLRRRGRRGARPRRRGRARRDAARPERQLLRPRPGARCAVRRRPGGAAPWAATCRSMAARTWPRCCAPSTASGRPDGLPPSRACGS